MAANTDVSLHTIAQRVAIYHDVEAIQQLTGAKATQIVSFLSETKYKDLTPTAILQRHKLGRYLLQGLQIGKLQNIEPFSQNEVLQLSLSDIKKAAS